MFFLLQLPQIITSLCKADVNFSLLLYFLSLSILEMVSLIGMDGMIFFTEKLRCFFIDSITSANSLGSLTFFKVIGGFSSSITTISPIVSFCILLSL